MKTNMCPKVKKLSYNLIGIAVLYVLCFCYGRHVDVTSGVNLDLVDVRYSNAIMDAAKSYDVHPALIAAVIQAESNFNPRAVSGAGARGLMQIVPSTQRYLRLKNAYDPHQNIDAGSRYLRELLDTFNGNLVMTIAAYNAGPNAVSRHDGVPPYRETRNYVKKVLAYYDLFRQAFSSGPLMS